MTVFLAAASKLGALNAFVAAVDSVWILELYYFA